jgi:hypothetical protein
MSDWIADEAKRLAAEKATWDKDLENQKFERETLLRLAPDLFASLVAGYPKIQRKLSRVRKATSAP